MATAPVRWAALLKGVNVRGHRRLPMADLRSLAQAAGLTDVVTLLASGNLVFTATETNPARVAAMLEAALARAGVRTEVVMRSKPQLEAVLAHNPFPDAARDDPSHYLVVFHRDPLPPTLLDGFVPGGPERMAAHGEELFIDFGGFMRESKLPEAMARAKFPQPATGRNWNTVNKLAALL